MKSLIAALVFIAVGAQAQTPANTATPAGAAQTFTVDAATSSVKWVGKKVTGQHDGTINVKSGTVTFNKGALTGGTLVMDMTTIKVLDLKDKKQNADLTGHLNSDDFFSTAKHKEATLVIKSAKAAGMETEVMADLTIKGITKPVTFKVAVKTDKQMAMATGKIVVDRTAFDIKYGSASFFKGLADKAIDNNFELTVDVKAKM